jgi:hypothetical protein
MPCNRAQVNKCRNHQAMCLDCPPIAQLTRFRPPYRSHAWNQRGRFSPGWRARRATHDRLVMVRDLRRGKRPRYNPGGIRLHRSALLLCEAAQRWLKDWEAQ